MQDITMPSRPRKPSLTEESKEQPRIAQVAGGSGSSRLRTQNDPAQPDAGSHLHRYEQLIEAAKIVNSTLDLNKLLNIIAETALKNVGADRGTLYLVDTARQELWSKVINDPALDEIRLPLGKGIAGYVAVTGDVVNIADAYADPRFNPEYDKKTGYLTKTILCMPLRNKDGKIIGVFQLLNKLRAKFDLDDISFIDALSVHAAIAVENARLYSQEREKIALEREFIAAREVQMSLIPKRLPKLPKFSFAACTIPAMEVGGDYYDFIRLDDNRYEIVIADVVGKGLPAALLAAVGKGIFYSQAMNTHSPSLHLKGSNSILRNHVPRKLFITSLIAIVDSPSMRVTLSNAGHCFPLLYRAATSMAEQLCIRGTALNFTDEIVCNDYSILLQAGDSVILYSDGVTEARNVCGDWFGVERLQATITRAAHEAPESLLRTVVNEIEVFSNDVQQSDDITILIMKATL